MPPRKRAASGSSLSDLDTPKVKSQAPRAKQSKSAQSGEKSPGNAKTVKKLKGDELKVEDENAVAGRGKVGSKRASYKVVKDEEEDEEDGDGREEVSSGLSSEEEIKPSARKKAKVSSTGEGSKAKAKATKPKPKGKKADDDEDQDGDEEAKPRKERKPRQPKVPKLDPWSPSELALHPARLGPSPADSSATSSSKPNPYLLPDGSPTHLIGAHTSTSSPVAGTGPGGPDYALWNASKLGARALALFVKSQRKWVSPDFKEEQLVRWGEGMKGLGDGAGLGYNQNLILPHGSYLINLGNPDEAKREMSYNCFVDDMKRLDQLGLTLYNWHPGSTTNACTKSESIAFIGAAINRAHAEVPNVIAVIECMAGAGSIIGSTWEELAEIIGHVKDRERVGVCIDTCHAFASGYDIRTRETYEATMASFDSIVGFKYLKAMHINDSQGGGLACKKDRHQNIGLGEIGLAAFRFLVRDPRTAGIPLILETPTFEETDVWAREIKALYDLQAVDGSDEEVQLILKDMTESLRADIAAIRKASGKEEKPKKAKAAAASKQGKKGAKEQDVDAASASESS